MFILNYIFSYEPPRREKYIPNPKAKRPPIPKPK